MMAKKVGRPFTPEQARALAIASNAKRREKRLQAESDRTGLPFAEVERLDALKTPAQRKRGKGGRPSAAPAEFQGNRRPPPPPLSAAGAQVSAAQKSGTYDEFMPPALAAVAADAVAEARAAINAEVEAIRESDRVPYDDADNGLDGEAAPPIGLDRWQEPRRVIPPPQAGPTGSENITRLFRDFPDFTDDTWLAWRAFLKAIDGLELDDAEMEQFTKFTGRTRSPRKPVREAHVIVGRRGGKTATAALIAVDRATRKRNWKLSPGEWATIPLIAADRTQAQTLMGYVRGMLSDVPRFKQLIQGKSARERIDLSTRTRIAIHTASFRTTRGYTLAAAVADEVAFWRSEETAANPDREVFAAIKPGLLTSGGPLISISSPYARSGVLWDAYKKYYGVEDAPVLVWKAQTTDMNRALSEDAKAEIAQAFEDDPQAASAEYGGEFRADLETFISEELLMRMVPPGRRELEPS